MKFIKNNPLTNLKIILITLLLSNMAYAQDNDNSDWGLWNTVGLNYKWNEKLSLGLEGQFRLKEDFSTIDEYFSQLEADYEVFKNFEVGVGLRYIRENDNQGNIQGYENHLRYHLDAKYKHKLERFTLGYRLRFQNKNELGISSSEGDNPIQNIRLKAAIKYNIKNWSLDPKFSAEIFNRSQEGEGNGFSKYRLTFGTDYELNKLGKIGVFYRMEKELNVDTPEITNIIGLKYIYTFKNN